MSYVQHLVGVRKSMPSKVIKRAVDQLISIHVCGNPTNPS